MVSNRTIAITVLVPGIIVSVISIYVIQKHFCDILISDQCSLGKFRNRCQILLLPSIRSDFSSCVKVFEESNETDASAECDWKILKRASLEAANWTCGRA